MGMGSPPAVRAPVFCCAKNLPGLGGQGSLLQQDWGSSCSRIRAHPTATLAPGSSASADIKHDPLTKQKNPQGLEKPV